MLRFVYDNIKLYNVRERRVQLTEAIPKVLYRPFNVFCERFEVIMDNHGCLDALRRLVVTTLYVLNSLIVIIVNVNEW